MTWWGREAWGAPPKGSMRKAALPARVRPRPLPVERDAVSRAVTARIKSYTPEWTDQRAGDAGAALLTLFAEEMETVLARADRLPDKSFVEYLGDAGVSPLAATPATAMLAFEVSNGAPESVLVPSGFQVGAKPATGGSDLVVFETTRDLFAAPAVISELHLEDESGFTRLSIPTEGAPLLPFGRKAQAGRALYIGLQADATAKLSERLSIGVGIAAPPGAPPPVPAGGLLSLPTPPPPLLRWELLDGNRWVPVEVNVDETGSLVRGGIIELSLPLSWTPGRPPRISGTTPLRWLRLRVLYGRFPEPPSLSLLILNAAPSVAARTIRDEILQPIAGSGGRRLRLSQVPVLVGSVILEVDEASGQSSRGATASRFTEVQSLAGAGPDDKVFVLDPSTGEVEFGDGVSGAAPPAGVENVRALSYQVGGGAAGAVDTGAVSIPISSAAFVTAVSNPAPASGGMDVEARADTLRRGPQEIRARNRAVAVADYELMALRSPGAQVVRAHAVSGLHPAYPGLPVPGLVGIYVVPPERGEGAPTPDDGSLAAVAQFLSAKVAPAGVEVVAAAPRYHKVRAEIGVVIDPAADAGATVRRLVQALDAYIDPITGGEDGDGWPFGDALRYSPLLRRLVTGVSGVRAITRLALVVDGVRIAPCGDFATAPHALLWPDVHEVVPDGPSPGTAQGNAS